MQWLTRTRFSLALSIAVVGACCAASCSAGKSSGAVAGTGGSGVGVTATGTTAATFSSGTMTTTASGTGGSMPTQPCDQGSCNLAGGMCVNNVCTINENPGNVDSTTKGELDAGGNADAAFAWLYPYDATVFPRGLSAPTMQFGGANPDAMKVKVTSPGMNYTGYYGASSPGRVSVSAAVWKAITLAAGPLDDLKVEVTKVSGGMAAGPIQETWTIAQGSLRGTIYYETYGSQLAGGLGSVGIMKIAPGATQPTVIKTGCGNVCHTASADGSTLVASTAFPSGSSSYDLSNGAATIKANPDNSFTYGGIYPDGSFVVSATNYRTWTPGFFGSGPSRVYDTHTGAQTPTASWDSAVTNAAMPAFSPDGNYIVFNREDTGQGKSLATMKYDHASNTFSALTDVTASTTEYLGWPAFTPDSKWIVYHAGSSQVFETDSNATGDLMIVDPATHQTARLDSLDGYKNGSTYLPANDPNLNFAPTVLPEAVGGYFWVVFTSHRSYGNTLPSKDNMDQNGKLWVAAIDLKPQDGKDPSHPAFYISGQEAGADNLRGFWVLDPCQKDGNTCVTGDQCCGGFCEMGMCSATHTGCAKEFEKCSSAADCCDPGSLCINGHCAAPPPM